MTPPKTEESDDGIAGNPITFDELKEIVTTARIVGIKKVTIRTKYGIDVHRTTLKSDFYKGVKIEKIVSEF